MDNTQTKYFQEESAFKQTSPLAADGKYKQALSRQLR